MHLLQDLKKIKPFSHRHVICIDCKILQHMVIWKEVIWGTDKKTMF